MATCYYLLNHTKREYLDLGKRYLKSDWTEVFGGYERPDTTDTQVVDYLLGSRQDELQFVSDVEAELDFLDVYKAVPPPEEETAPDEVL